MLVLGFLKTRGPAHGYEILRQAQAMNVEAWADVSIGSLYHALRTMTAAGLLEVARVERAGNYPSRRVYALTDAGRRELATLLDAALTDTSLPPDPFDIALTAGLGRDLDKLPAALSSRRRELRAALAELRARRAQLLAQRQIGARAEAVFLHQELRLRTEISFHDRLAQLMPTLVDEAPLWATGSVARDAAVAPA